MLNVTIYFKMTSKLNNPHYNPLKTTIKRTTFNIKTFHIDPLITPYIHNRSRPHLILSIIIKFITLASNSP